MQSKFTIMRANRWKMAEAKARAARRHYNIEVDYWPDISLEYSKPAFVLWNQKHGGYKLLQLIRNSGINTPATANTL